MTNELDTSRRAAESGGVQAGPGAAGGRRPRRRSSRSPEELAAERALIRRAKAGDKDAFGELVRAYEKKAFWVAYNHLSDTEDALDVVQDAFLRVYNALERFDMRYNFYTWFYRIVVNLAIDRLRKKGKQGSVSIEEFPTDPSYESAPEEGLRRTETGQKIEEVLDSLPEKYKTVILLRDVHEMSCEEIAQIIGCTNATTRWRLHRARELFRARWGRIEV